MVARQPWWFWWMGISALLVCIGSVGPWASVLFITVSGTKGDGQGTLVAGIAALIFIAVYVRSSARPRPAWPLVLTLLAGIAAGGVGVYDWANIQRSIDEAQSEENIFAATISVEWGLILVTFAGLSLAAGAVTTFTRRNHEPAVVVSAAARLDRQTRECPHCKEQMRRDAGVCPHCRRESQAWQLHENVWWAKDASGRWLYLDAAQNRWVLREDEPPVAIAVQPRSPTPEEESSG